MDYFIGIQIINPMKSILLLGTLFTLWFFQTESNIHIVKLGKAPDCNGFNFCSISTNNSQTTSENEVLATITVANEKHIQFSFLKRSVTDRMFLKYFATGTFILDDDFIFNSENCQALNLTRCTLKQGKYTITDEYDKYVVEFSY